MTQHEKITCGSGVLKPQMERDQILAVLSAHSDELRRRGVLHAALFGSIARGDATSESDIDILVDIDPEAHIGVFGYVSIKHYLEDIFTTPVDLVNRKTLKAAIRPFVIKDALYAF